MKNNRVKQWCEKCRKKTVHETRLINDEELLVCLKCYIEPQFDYKTLNKTANPMNYVERFGGRHP